MELGEKLRMARMEAGLTQRELCQDVVTRNMLSQIENGSAKPSMKTLQIFAQRLGKSVSFFLEESAVLSPNLRVIEEARSRFDAGAYPQALTALEAYQTPDGVYDREKQLLETLCFLQLAQQALDTNREGYARELLKKAEGETAYCSQEINRRRLLLQGRLRGERVSGSLPSLDEELMLRAGESEDPKRAAALLDACEDQKKPKWNLLRGKAWMAQKAYAKAEKCLSAAQVRYPRETAPLLEECFREQGDYKRAYEYACRQKDVKKGK